MLSVIPTGCCSRISRDLGEVMVRGVIAAQRGDQREFGGGQRRHARVAGAGASGRASAAAAAAFDQAPVASWK